MSPFKFVGIHVPYGHNVAMNLGPAGRAALAGTDGALISLEVHYR